MGVRLTVRSSWSAEGGSSPCVYELDQERIVVGRDAGSDVRLPHEAVSGTHATIRVQGTGYVVQDEASTNGTRVNGTPIPPKRPKPLRTGDVVTLGGFALTIEIGVPITQATTVDRTGALARKLVRELLDPDGTATPPPRLLVLDGPDEGRSIELAEPPVRVVIGRGETCDLVLSDADASREHAELERDLDGVVVRDLGSKNGVLVNDRRISERRLRDRDEVLLGGTVLVFEDPMEQLLRQIAAEPDRAMETPEPAPEAPAAASPAPAPAPALDAGPTGTDGTGRAPITATERTPRAPEPARDRAGASADLIIYLLAGAVLALSIVGLYILLRAG